MKLTERWVRLIVLSLILICGVAGCSGQDGRLLEEFLRKIGPIASIITLLSISLGTYAGTLVSRLRKDKIELARGHNTCLLSKSAFAAGLFSPIFLVIGFVCLILNVLLYNLKSPSLDVVMAMLLSWGLNLVMVSFPLGISAIVFNIISLVYLKIKSAMTDIDAMLLAVAFIAAGLPFLIVTFITFPVLWDSTFPGMQYP